MVCHYSDSWMFSQCRPSPTPTLDTHTHIRDVKVTVFHTSIYLLCTGLNGWRDTHKGTKRESQVLLWVSVHVHSFVLRVCVCVGVNYCLLSALKPPGKSTFMASLLPFFIFPFLPLSVPWFLHALSNSDGGLLVGGS